MKKITFILFFMAVATTVFSSKPPVVFERFVQGEGLNATNKVLSTSQGVDEAQCARICTQDSRCLYFRVQEETCTLYRETPYGQNHLAGATYYTFHDDPCPVAKGYISVSRPRLCFKLYKESKTWPDSDNQCESEGARLIILNTDHRHGYVKQYLNAELGTYMTWVGMTKIGGVSTWSDGTLAVTKWSDGEPDDVDYQNYIALENHGGLIVGLTDISWNNMCTFICEILM